MIFILIILLALFNVTMFNQLSVNPDYYQLDAYTWESEDFRAMKLGEAVAAMDAIDYDKLTTWMIKQEYDLTGFKEAPYSNRQLLLKKPVEYKKLRNAYQMILEDLKYFPVPLNTDENSPGVVFDNSWQELRTYGGERGHEGCDIMGNQKERGYYPVLSISDGVVEKVGWLEKGGWRIGIRTPGGTYLYYAHLFSYSREWKEGDQVKAGELLGYMGDSGYGKTEGTVGNFDVHLHLGIYIKTDNYEEISVNPYWILRYLEKRRLTYTY